MYLNFLKLIKVVTSDIYYSIRSKNQLFAIIIQTLICVVNKNIFIFLQVDIIIAEFTADDCKLLGFNKANVLCSTCERFSDPELVKILYV